MILPKFAWRVAATFAVCLLSSPLEGSAALTITVDAGYLRQDSTTALNSTTGGGALLLLVASGAANGQTFTATPSAGTYVAGGDTIVAAFGLNVVATSSNGIGKETFNTLNSIASPTSVVAGSYLELRWYPNITLAQYNAGSTPTAGSLFGAYNPLVTNSSGNTTLNPDGNDAWKLPSDGAIIRLNFYTNEPPGGGSQLVSEGYANFLVPAAVPEPSGGILAGLALVTIAGARRWLRRVNGD